MVIKKIIWDPKFEATFRKIKDKSTKDRIRKQIKKIIDNPEIGKPLRYARKGEREVRVGGSRLIYSIIGETLIILGYIPHKKL